MAWRDSTCDRNGVTMRRCSKTGHKGARWLVLSLANFFSLDSYYCKDCQRTYARLNWQRKNPKVTRKPAVRKTQKNSAADALGHAMSGWRNSW
jgi:hypothetical protein